MRVSTAYQYDSLNQSVAQAHEAYVKATNAVSTGRKLSVPSDNPYGTRVVLRAESLRQAAERYTQNLNYGKTFLSVGESSLSDVNTVMLRVQDLAVQGANVASTAEGRSAMVSELQSLQNRLVQIGNTVGPNGQYVFAGKHSDIKPFSETDGQISFAGDQGPITIEASSSATVTLNVPAGDLFVNAYNAISKLKSDLQAGQGATISAEDIDIVKTSRQALVDARAKIGVQLTEIDQYATDHARRTDEFAAQISDQTDVDITEAITKYKVAETAYNAALQVAGQGFRLSLLDFIR